MATLTKREDELRAAGVMLWLCFARLPGILQAT